MEIQRSIISQYHAVLQMLAAAVDACPVALWDSGDEQNRFWHVAYHGLYYTHLYLSPWEEEFHPWSKARADYHFFGPLPWPPHTVPDIGDAYTKPDIQEYQRLVYSAVESCVAEVPLEQPSGFSWLPMNRFELHLYNIRHLAHHAGQLIDRLRREAGTGIEWMRWGGEEKAKD